MKTKQFKASNEHWGEFVMNVERLGFNALVITSMIVGTKDLHFGRVVQVRKKSGAYGSDTVLIRLSNGKLQSYHNMGFFIPKKEYAAMYEAQMKTTDERKLDTGENEYSIEGKNKAKGFVVEGLDDTNGAVYSFAIEKTDNHTSITF